MKLIKKLFYQKINNFIDQTVAENPEVASSYIAGKTYENRDIKVIVLNPIKTSTRSLWIDCGIHAREWVTHATCVYSINKVFLFILTLKFNLNDKIMLKVLRRI